MSLATDCVKHLDKHVPDWRDLVQNTLTAEMIEAIQVVAIENGVMFFDIHDIHNELKGLCSTL